MAICPEHLGGRSLARRASRLLLAAAVGAGGGGLAVGFFGTLCGLIVAGLHGRPDRVMVLGEWGALAGAAAGALALAFDFLFDGELFDDLVCLVWPRRAVPPDQTDEPLRHNRVASRFPVRRPGVLSARKRRPEREPGSWWEGPFSSN
jgi:hypothetical protein